MASIWEDLGITPVINAQGNRTLLGGNTPVPEVQQVMDEMEEYYVDMGDLFDKVSERIAEMLVMGVPSSSPTRNPPASAARKQPASPMPGFQPSAAAQSMARSRSARLMARIL